MLDHYFEVAPVDSHDWGVRRMILSGCRWARDGVDERLCRRLLLPVGSIRATWRLTAPGYPL